MLFDEFERWFGNLSNRFFPWNDNSNNSLNQVEGSGPYYYGYEMTIGPNGKPRVREWGNARPNTSSVLNDGVRNVYADQIIDEENKTLKIVTEMPGIEKSDIKISIESGIVHVTAERDQRKYRTDIPLSHKIVEDSAKAHYANGILEITFKLGEEKPKGKVVSVE